jgi:hypothetical protein
MGIFYSCQGDTQRSGVTGGGNVLPIRASSLHAFARANRQAEA